MKVIITRNTSKPILILTITPTGLQNHNWDQNIPFWILKNNCLQEVSNVSSFSHVKCYEILNTEEEKEKNIVAHDLLEK